MATLDLSTKFPQMKPMKGTPTLFRVNGCGVGLYGHRDDDAETGTYVATWCLALVFVPVLCLKAFRVHRAMNGMWYFIGREPLSPLARAWNALLILAILGGVGFTRYEAYTSTPAYKVI